MSENRRVLITGISGYLGSHLARSLLGKGFEVHGLIREESDLSLLGEACEQVLLHTFHGKTEGLIDIIKQVEPETVFHLASLFRASHVTADVVPLVESNILFGAQLLEAMSVTGVKNLVNTGTLWQNYNGEAYNPVALYSATKEAFETLIRFYTETDKLRAITLKLTDTFGPKDARRKIFNLIVKASESPESFGMTGGDQLIDIVYVDDVVSAFEVAREALEKGDFKNRVRLVSTGAPITVKSLVATFEKVSGRKVPVEWGKLPYRPREMFTPWQSDPILENWKPQVTLEDGIRSILK